MVLLTCSPEVQGHCLRQAAGCNNPVYNISAAKVAWGPGLHHAGSAAFWNLEINAGLPVPCASLEGLFAASIMTNRLFYMYASCMYGRSGAGLLTTSSTSR